MTTERSEHELLRLCARARLGPIDVPHVERLLDSRLDWTYVLGLARHHQLVPLLDECVRAVGRESLPETVCAALGQEVHRVRARVHQLTRELVRIHHLAGATGVRLLSFKGPVLAMTLHGDPASRQFGDLDMLADPASFPASQAFLSTLGYRPLRDHDYEVKLSHERTGILVDLHRTLSPSNFPVAARFTRLWERRALLPLEDGTVETLSPPDAFVTLCIEAVKDARQGKVRLGKMADLTRAAALDVDWDHVEAMARELGLQRVVAFALNLAADVLRVRVSAPPRLAARHRALVRFHRDGTAAVFPNGEPVRPTRLHGERFHFHVRERWRDRLHPYVRSTHRLVTPNRLDRQFLPLPAWLSFAHYVVRPLRLTYVYGGRLGKALFLSGSRSTS